MSFAMIYTCAHCARLLQSYLEAREHFEETGHKIIEAVTL
jgi:hypothetical protein